MEKYRDTGNECKRRPYTHDAFYTSLIINIRSVIGMLKGKTAIKIFKSFPTFKKKPYRGNHFKRRGYCVNAIGLNETKIKKDVRHQEEKQKDGDQQEFGLSWRTLKTTR